MHGGVKSTKETEGSSAKVLAPFVSLLYGGWGAVLAQWLKVLDCCVLGRWVRMKQTTALFIKQGNLSLLQGH